MEQSAERADRLLEHLLDQQASLAAGAWADVPSPGLLAEGQALLRGAADSARRLGDEFRAGARS